MTPTQKWVCGMYVAGAQLKIYIQVKVKRQFQPVPCAKKQSPGAWMFKQDGSNVTHQLEAGEPGLQDGWREEGLGAWTAQSCGQGWREGALGHKSLGSNLSSASFQS